MKNKNRSGKKKHLEDVCERFNAPNCWINTCTDNALCSLFTTCSLVGDPRYPLYVGYILSLVREKVIKCILNSHDNDSQIVENIEEDSDEVNEDTF